MKRFDFWQKWLFIVAVVMAVFGLSLAFFSQSAAFDLLFNNQINPGFWGQGQVASQVATFQGWIYGILGATVAGWAICLGFIAWYPFRQRQLWAWHCVAWCLSVWYILDTGLSLYFGVYFNAVFNTILLVAGLLPVLFTRKEFQEV
jgi:hypothetical protein